MDTNGFCTGWTKEDHAQGGFVPFEAKGRGGKKGTGKITENKNAPGVKAVVKQISSGE